MCTGGSSKAHVEQDLFATGFNTCETGPPWSTKFLRKQFQSKNYGGVRAGLTQGLVNFSGVTAFRRQPVFDSHFQSLTSKIFLFFFK